MRIECSCHDYRIFETAEKTIPVILGELNSRLNVDVQEFKSAFKLTIAQGLRTLAQVLTFLYFEVLSFTCAKSYCTKGLA